MIQRWEPEDFVLQKDSIWRFPDRGDWATHKGDYRGNWSPYVPRNLILRYSNIGDLILDPFVGSGTTLIEAKLLCRDAIGVDINPYALRIAKARTRFIHAGADGKVYIKQGDAKDMFFIPEASIDLACVHPPYADIIKYSEDIEGDISNLAIPDFIDSMGAVAEELYRVLKVKKICAILVGDVRKKGEVVPVGFQTLSKFLAAGFSLKEIVIKQQFNCKMTNKWTALSEQRNFLLMAHEYLFILKKSGDNTVKMIDLL